MQEHCCLSRGLQTIFGEEHQQGEIVEEELGKGKPQNLKP